jgi:hypothetical protein
MVTPFKEPGTKMVDGVRDEINRVGLDVVARFAVNEGRG